VVSVHPGDRAVDFDQLVERRAGATAGFVEPVPSPPLRRILVAVDAVALAVGWLAVETVLARRGGGGTTAAVHVVVVTLAGTGVGLSLLSASGLYQRRICQVRSLELARIARVAGLLALLGGLRSAGVATGTTLLAATVGGVTWLLVLGIERGIIREWIAGRRAHGDYRAPVLVVGAGQAAMRTAAFLEAHPVLGFDVRGVAGPDRVPDGTSPWLADLGSTAAAARRAGATGVVVDGGSLTGDQLNGAVHDLSAGGLHVHVTSGLRGVDWRRITVAPMADETVLHIAPARLSRLQQRAKRALDVAVAATLLLLSAPLFAVVAAGVWLGDRGPILFRQDRVGRDGAIFTLAKFRTMVPHAEERLEELRDGNLRTGPLFKMERDPRVTRLGRFLRASSLDELPQLVHVLTGSMSMVGPRPALPDEVAQFDDELSARTRVKPGVTGLWQVEARDQPSFELYRRYDLLYVENWSVSLDVAIIARTFTSTLVRGLRALGSAPGPAHERAGPSRREG
jgi:exopolysaccharide biosynthesis polyprenyl glycosylphosphotransferase